MAKGDDVRRRKLNKAQRKKSQKETSSAVSARVAALIAAKKRRKSGKRRMCEGMCFSLPMPDDPFNDRHGKKKGGTKDTRKTKVPRESVKILAKGDHGLQKERSISDEKSRDTVAPKRLKMVNSVNHQDVVCTEKIHPESLSKLEKGAQSLSKTVSPSKYLLLCFKSIRDSFVEEVEPSAEQEKSIIIDKWGVKFWKSYSVGKDIQETSGTKAVVEQIAWIASTAADAIARKEKDGGSFSSPFLLYLVPSQKDAVKVRSVCKPLKALGVHTVSLHPGATVDHQIHGLKSCEPEFLVATPKRLWELVSLEAIDISGVSLLVVDGLADFAENGSLDVLNSIRQSVPENSRTVVFQGSPSSFSVEAVRNILKEPIAYLSLDNSARSMSAIPAQR